MDASARLVRFYAQENQMMILTANRNMKGDDSLEQVTREENTADSFPVLTIADIDRLDEFDYRELCVERLVEIVLEVGNYMELVGYSFRDIDINLPNSIATAVQLSVRQQSELEHFKKILKEGHHHEPDSPL